MAVTAAAVQAVLGSNPNNARIIHSAGEQIGGLQHWYVQGNLDAVGRDRFIATTASGSAAVQAAAILAALRA